MSLPTIAELYLRGRRVGSIRVNVGWYYDDEYVPRAINEALRVNKEVPEFDQVFVYDKWWTRGPGKDPNARG